METGRVLIVDNENLVCWSLAKMLKQNQHQVDIANTGAAARRCMESFNPDLIILDASLPDMDGLALLKEIRTQKPDFPIIITTASYHSDLAFQAKSGKTLPATTGRETTQEISARSTGRKLPFYG